MSENTLKKINNIPIRTWRWFGVNNTSLEESIPEIKPYKNEIMNEDYRNCEKLRDTKGGKLSILDTFDYKGIKSDLTDFAKKNYNTGFLVQNSEYEKKDEPIIINYGFDNENNVVVDNNVIVAEEGSEITVVVNYNSKDDGNYFHNGLTRIYGKKGSTINLIKVQTLSDKSVHLDSNVAKLEDNATINYVLVELGSKESVTNFKTDLNGYKSSANMHTVYIGDKNRKIDINYLVNHFGKQTKSLIDAKGALLDESNKTFKGTLDFKKGSKGSKGSEEEYVVLLSPKVRNRSVPILLCTEDDVDGQHAASSGKIDQNKLFYLMSRGLSEKQARKLIIEAAFDPILNKIPNKNIKDEISIAIRRKLTDEQ